MLKKIAVLLLISTSLLAGPFEDQQLINVVMRTRRVSEIKPILDQGANANTYSEAFGMPVLQLLIPQRGYDAIKLLIDRGADINAHNILGETALHRTIMSKNRDLLLLFIESKAYLMSKDKKGDTPLHKAISMNHKEIVELLLEQPNIQVLIYNNEHKTPLDKARELGNKNIIEIMEKAEIKEKIENFGKLAQNAELLSDVILYWSKKD